MHLKGGEVVSSYSTRKGAPSHAPSITGLVNAVSLWLRVRWSLGGVIPAYIHIQDGGDQSAGRSICGLSPVDADFSILPPRFKVNATVNFADAVVGYETYPSLRISK